MTSAPVRLQSPGELAAAVPLLVGFTPAESLVVLSLREPRGRLGLTMRFDLPGPREEPLLTVEVLARLRRDRATRAAIVIFTAAPDVDGRLPRQTLAVGLEEALVAGGLGAGDLLLVRGPRWWSYVCADDTCCPRGGSPVQSSPAVQAAHAGLVLGGAAVLASREALVDSIAPRLPAALLTATLQAATLQAAADREAAGGQQWGHWLDSYARSPGGIGDEDAARLIVSLRDPRVRDGLLAGTPRHQDALTGLLHDLARRSTGPWDPPVCTALAWVAAAAGNGALANVALDRALLAEPSYELARLLRQALDAQLPPATLRRILAAGGATPPLRRRRQGRGRRAA